MSDPGLIIAVILAFLTVIGTVAKVASLIIQHRRTLKLPEPPIQPTCTTILGFDMHRHRWGMRSCLRARPSSC